MMPIRHKPQCIVNFRRKFHAVHGSCHHLRNPGFGRIAPSADNADHYVTLRKDAQELLSIQNEYRPYVLIIHYLDGR